MTMTRAYAGQIAANGQALHKTTCEKLTTSKPLTAGLFVAYADRGVKEIVDNRDYIAGVIVRNHLTDEFKNGEPVDVMHIGTGDEIWVQLAPDSLVARGETVVVVMTGEHAGLVTKGDPDNETIAYTALEVAGNLVRITKY